MGHISRRTFLGTVSVSGIGILAGCISNTDDERTVPDTDDEIDIPDSPVGFSRITMGVTEDNVHFIRPRITHIAVGGTAEWVLDGGVHTATALRSDASLDFDSFGRDWQTGKLTALMYTNEIAINFDTPGIFDYGCSAPAHEKLGMVGRVIVGSPDLASEPAFTGSYPDLSPAASRQIQEYNKQTIALLSQ